MSYDNASSLTLTMSAWQVRHAVKETFVFLS